jgi:hypothetical protein
MTTHRVFAMPFAAVHQAYVNKAVRKGRKREEVDTDIRWLTGYDAAGFARQLEAQVNVATFFTQAPALHPHREAIPVWSAACAWKRSRIR